MLSLSLALAFTLVRELTHTFSHSEYKGSPVADDVTLVSLELTPKEKEAMQVNFVFNLNKNAAANPAPS